MLKFTSEGWTLIINSATAFCKVCEGREELVWNESLLIYGKEKQHLRHYC